MDSIQTQHVAKPHRPWTQSGIGKEDSYKSPRRVVTINNTERKSNGRTMCRDTQLSERCVLKGRYIYTEFTEPT